MFQGSQGNTISGEVNVFKYKCLILYILFYYETTKLSSNLNETQFCLFHQLLQSGLLFNTRDVFVSTRGYFGAVGLVARVAGNAALFPKFPLEMTIQCPLNLRDLNIVAQSLLETNYTGSVET